MRVVEGPPPHEGQKTERQRVPVGQNETGGEWPLSLKSYVNICFKTCKSDLEKDKMEALLKVKIR